MGMSKAHRIKRPARQSISESISVSLGLQNNDARQSDNENPLQVLPGESSYLGRSYVSGLWSPTQRNNKSGYDLLPTSNEQAYSKPIHKSQMLHRQTQAIGENFSDSNGDEGSENKDLNEYIDLVEHNERKTANIDNVDQIGGLATGPQTTVPGNKTHPVTSPLSDEYGIPDENSRLLLTPVSSLSVAISDASSLTPEDYNGRARSPLNGINSTYGSQIPTLSSYSSAGMKIGPPITSKWDYISALSHDIVHYLPASILGLLLNILDALSYGMIIFPITEPIFSQLGPSGLSMFYISTVISQFTYSSGWSSFPCGIGSEMIEVTPFFHTMALTIMKTLGEERKNEIITTTIFCYVISSMFTGLTFFTLGKLKLGKLVGFFPRHILIGCIGGVGYFLLITGIEVCTRIAKFEYSIPFLLNLFTDEKTLFQWLLPTMLTIILIFTQNRFRNSLVLPSFYILTLILFHFIVAIVPNLSLTKLRNSGWIFPVAASNVTWYDHYKYFNFSDVHWALVIKQIPTMMALTFFGILHVPINVPALAMSLQMDKYDVDRELIAHGYSNFFSGLFGSIENYLVYTNSVLFIRAGADSALAGYILIVLTIIVMLIGPVIISFIPICIVGSLIFLLGYELLMEALVDTWGKLNTFEYVTVGIIILTMGIFDFVLGIIVGILIACFKFLIDSTHLQTVNGEFSGEVAKSTVYRDPIQTTFLDGVGEQIYVLKLQNLLFFGTIISIEEKIDKLLEISNNDSSKRRIKYLILDFKNINTDNIDYSAAEGFNRIRRFTQTKGIQLIISSIREKDGIYRAFNNVGLLEDVELFQDLNSSLEWCENELLHWYNELRTKAKARLRKLNNTANSVVSRLPVSASKQMDSRAITSADQSGRAAISNLMSLPTNTPRNHQMLTVAQDVFKNDEQTVSSLRKQLKTKDPLLPLLLLTLKQYRPDIGSNDKLARDKEIAIWSRLCPYFAKKTMMAQTTLQHCNKIFFLVQTGVLKAVFKLPQGCVYETMANRTCYGKIIDSGTTVDDADTSNPDFSKLFITTETDSELWVIDAAAMGRLEREDPELFIQLALLVMLIKDKRFKDLLGHALISA
ncbi:Vsb1p KNAG_0B00860 [Huiozyma naganishii CBS 8797]|uniref:STAS domain-containing protein n=1 Tax=Huiozyma naganishii (strain ATCC MYA-139 / BCRC 22969 / CBS 8797 / KCTC 17520 / NBRC 10181 / NCYC 3082 / Yp74L-3) TaxID=1071383 RepID=J7RG71_HUIN7|nr:hypothetical protein KNAG_0B00860 [Kazachstania naganishii CBS 8797]CCK68533.1 hypothetical protein KNAG_0B00860 [Kazachstania naganishii CBS 8797]